MAPLVDAILLDLGNVLVFHDDRKLMAALAALGPRSPDEVARALAPLWDDCYRGRLAGAHLRRAVAGAAGAPGGDLDEATFRRVWSCHFTPHTAVLPLVESLVGRVKLFLLSNTNAAHVEHIRPTLPVLDRFDGLVLSYEVGATKPQPAIFDEAVRRAATAPARTAFFDDVEAYVVAARNLGLRGHVFTDAPRFAQQLAALGL